MYRNTFGFMLKLTTALLKKPAMLYMWNVKQKHDGMDQSTIPFCYGDYVTTNPGLSQRYPSLIMFYLTNFWMDNIQLSAHHKKSVKKNKTNPS